MGPYKRLMKVSILTLMLLISFSFVVFPIHGQAKPKVSIVPKDNIFSTDPTAPNYKAVGDTFTVSVTTSGWEDPGVFAYECKLRFDPTLLELTAVEYPADHFIVKDLPAGTPVFTAPVDAATIAEANVNGYIGLAASPLADPAAVGGRKGSGVLAKATFKIKTAPPALGSVSCAIRVNDVSFLNPAGDKVAVDLEDGYYEYSAPRPPTPFMKVVPESVSAQTIGQEVAIDITVQQLSKDWRAVGFEWKLTFDSSLLEYVNATEGDFLKAFGPTVFYAVQENNYVISFSLLYKEPWPPEVFPEGSGSLATIKFKAIAPGACDLTLSETLIVNVDGEEVETGPPVSGKYAFSPPWLSVEPKEKTLKNLGETFDLNVLINNLVKDWKLVGVEFIVRYNNTLLETNADMIKEGDFIKGFAQRVGTETWFQAIVEPEISPGVGLVGILILPLQLPDGTYEWPYEVFPEGDGVLATFTFKAIYQHETEDITDYIMVDEPLLANVEAKVIPVDLQKTAVEGRCKYTITKRYVPPPPGRVVDLYTQYAYPYGGQGLDMPSDAFAPQGQAKLIAKVTYRGDPVADKPVAYQIRGPKGYEFLATQFTDSNGEAILQFTVPASKAYFGIWNVTASVDIAGEVVSDRLLFRVGYLISVKEIRIAEELVKGESYGIGSTVKVITMQPPNKCVQLNGLASKTLLVYSGLDELKQPLFSHYMLLNVGYFKDGVPSKADMLSFVLLGGREIDVLPTSITIPKSAYSGDAKIIGDVFTDFPWFQGVPYSESTIKQVKIRAPAPPPPAPAPTAVLSVSGATVRTGKDFTVNVKIKDVDADAHIVAIEFRVKFDPSLLDVLNVTEGDFVKQFGETAIMWSLNGDVLFGILQLPPWPGPNGWMTGSGTVAQIQFHAKASGSCILTLTDAYMVNEVGGIVDFQRLENGLVIIAE
jgi:hypothetical protein